MTNMDYKYIEQLLERYWNCETSLEEEQILRSFFTQKDIPAEMMKYKALFSYENGEIKDDVLGAAFDARMMSLVDEPEPVVARTVTVKSRFMPLFKAAAAVAVFISLGSLSQSLFTTDGNASSGIRYGRSISAAGKAETADTLGSDTLTKVSATATILNK